VRSRCVLVLAVTTFVCLPAVASAVTDDFLDLEPHWATPRLGQPQASADAPVADDDALDGQVLELMYPGGTASEETGPGFATEISTVNERTFGLYEARLRTPKVGRATGLVSSFFTYFNDGKDHDGDGLVDNHEIDIEFLANEPDVIYMSVWTEYEADDGGERFRKTSRKVNLRTGQVWQTPAGGEASYELVPAEPLGWQARRFKHNRRFHTYRFEWIAGSVTFGVDLEDGAGMRTLWMLSGAPNVTIPSLVSPLRMNLWHNGAHWLSGKPARVPPRDVRYHIDRVTFP